MDSTQQQATSFRLYLQFLFADRFCPPWFAGCLFRALLVGLLLPSESLRAEAESYDAQRLTTRPNILLIVAEDMSPRVGAFGDAVASTPAIDQLASEGMRFERAYTVSGVCAPSRSSLMTGVYATSMGTHQMRTSQGVPGSEIETYEAVPPPAVKAFPELLRAVGYRTANFAKKDYQFGDPFTVWDLHRGQFIGPIEPALWRQLPDDKPWFVMMNLMSTHESRLVDASADYPERWSGMIKAIRKERAATVTAMTDPAAVRVPAYFPDTEKVRRSIAQHYDNIHYMDSQVASILNALADDGLSDNTVVIWTTDHGDAFPRAKRAVYESGTHVPLVIRFPERRDAGSVASRLVSFVDIAPTLLNLAGADVPEFIQGRDMLTGEPREYVFAARDRMDATYDRVRSVRDDRYRLIENFAPDLPYFRPLLFRDMFPIMQELWRADEDGSLNEQQRYWFSAPRPQYELYDVQADPDEVVNLADDPALVDVKARLIGALNDWRERVGDLGDLPELQMVEAMWGGRTQPQTVAPIVVTTDAAIVANTVADASVERVDGAEALNITLIEATPGSSIGYSIDGGPWQLYTAPFVASSDRSVEAKAIRYGFAESPIVEASPHKTDSQKQN